MKYYRETKYILERIYFNIKNILNMFVKINILWQEL